jgi:2-furoyl-CoA dehydrogenase large subunit
MHGAVTGAYDIANVDVVNRVVLTNKMPASLIRGFGGPQLYLALEHLVQRIAIELGLDHLEVIKRNLIPKEKFPYKAAAGALYDSGDYLRAVESATAEGRLDDLKRRRAAARAAGRHYGIGFAAVVEPGMSNMGYLSTLLTPEARDKAGPKNGAVSMVTVNVDPLGAVSVTADVTVQGQGHQTVLSQIVADRLGLSPDDVNVVLEMDTAKDQWSIAAGTYSCRFTPGTAVAAHLAAERMADKLKEIAAKQLNVLPADVELAGGKVRSRSNPDNALPFGRVAGTAHWSPVMLPDGMAPALRETAVWSPPELEPPSSDDRINTSLTYGFCFDMCGIEIDPVTFAVRVDRYVSIHDAGRQLNPMIVKGQQRGAFVQGLATALYEEYVYDESGQFLTGTFADYLVPTVAEVPACEMLHQETPSPFTPLGAKGAAEANCMSVPACIANAICDALGVANVELPATPRRIHALLAGPEPPRPRGVRV